MQIKEVDYPIISLFVDRENKKSYLIDITTDKIIKEFNVEIEDIIVLDRDLILLNVDAILCLFDLNTFELIFTDLLATYKAKCLPYTNDASCNGQGRYRYLNQREKVKYIVVEEERSSNILIIKNRKLLPYKSIGIQSRFLNITGDRYLIQRDSKEIKIYNVEGDIRSYQKLDTGYCMLECLGNKLYIIEMGDKYQATFIRIFDLLLMTFTHTIGERQVKLLNPIQYCITDKYIFNRVNDKMFMMSIEDEKIEDIILSDESFKIVKHNKGREGIPRIWSVTYAGGTNLLIHTTLEIGNVLFNYKTGETTKIENNRIRWSSHKVIALTPELSIIVNSEYSTDTYTEIEEANLLNLNIGKAERLKYKYVESFLMKRDRDIEEMRKIMGKSRLLTDRIKKLIIGFI